MNQTRIVVDARYRSKADRIMQDTGIHSLSQLFTLLLVNYGDKLLHALKEEQQ